MLRIVALCLALSVPSIAAAQSDVEMRDDLSKRIAEAVANARIEGASLEERLTILEQEFDLPDSIRSLGVESLQNEQVRALLNLPLAGKDGAADGADERYASDIFVLASFSMPAPSLKALLFDASAMGIPVVFRGFVNGSIMDTEAAVRAIYTQEDTSEGFTIDPTLFTRFDIQAVPVLISLASRMDVCDTQGCIDDPVPLHGRVTGNISLVEALTIIARGSGDAPAPAIAVLQRMK